MVIYLELKTLGIFLTVSQYTFNLDHAYHVPDMPKHLISVAKFTPNNNVRFSLIPKVTPLLTGFLVHIYFMAHVSMACIRFSYLTILSPL